MASKSVIHWIGAGLTSGPGIVSLANKFGQITVWDISLDRAEALKAHIAPDAILDVRYLKLDDDASRAAFASALNPGDVIVSMLPADFHVRVAKLALAEGCHLVTSSYLSDDMMTLNDAAMEKGLSLVNEAGLDPGIDHLLAHILVDEARKAHMLGQGHIIDFISYCGGFPVEESAFTYKFSWTPLGVLTALGNPAQVIRDGSVFSAAKAWENITELSFGGEHFEGYANRDSLPYIKEYGLQGEKLGNFVRGTLRLSGWKEAWKDIFTTVEQADEQALKDLSEKLWQEYQYGENEQDRAVLLVKLTATAQDGTGWQAALSLDITGSGWQSAMARTVSLTVAEAADAIMKGRLPAGVRAATHNVAEARKWLKGLREQGIEIKAENISLEGL
ncbi:Saccharopine dehydrogenase [NADP, L-glutamate-forming] [hydrothermal vent metagenome]|uniref:Saccharopine dehydrogenase [NADP, L-glutamate-forming] n=1 Tax=hydrothermal vent metagenome TaxID=652676 RepID=A0A3B0SGQ6_9ZZZZ